MECEWRRRFGVNHASRLVHILVYLGISFFRMTSFAVCFKDMIDVFLASNLRPFSSSGHGQVASWVWRPLVPALSMT
ncbi:hypothetical protein K505DRAFT_115919 [Melanomma pulvis-pyrius CBS 109.77]|uniref:Uncharacterized protein n=1 Tax=Melanomma pulvis-pyrius CBS 109.77 TaxID=1314802 RepID=A0A6A6WVM9_9PLEO|nr:hypothetical protein K505DRAFT_115919 [Melanomma pulvis-pyrius CBS 109.77]